MGFYSHKNWELRSDSEFMKVHGHHPDILTPFQWNWKNKIKLHQSSWEAQEWMLRTLAWSLSWSEILGALCWPFSMWNETSKFFWPMDFPFQKRAITIILTNHLTPGAPYFASESIKCSHDTRSETQNNSHLSVCSVPSKRTQGSLVNWA